MVIKYAELFAGAGGFRLGIEQAESYRRGIADAGQSERLALGDADGRCVEQPDRGREGFFSCVYSSEIDKHAAAVYRHIWRGESGRPCPELKEGDIREQSTDKVPDFDFLTAGFPCQSFSVAGKLGGFGDDRGTLFFEVARFLKDKQPKHFLLENVKGLLSSKTFLTFDTIAPILVSELIYGGAFWGEKFTPSDKWRIFEDNIRTYIAEILPSTSIYQNQRSGTSSINDSESACVPRGQGASYGLAAKLRFCLTQVLQMLRSPICLQHEPDTQYTLSADDLALTLECVLRQEHFRTVTDIGILEWMVCSLREAGLLCSDCLGENYPVLKSFTTSIGINPTTEKKTSIFVQELIIIAFLLKQHLLSSNLWKRVSSNSAKKKRSTFYVRTFNIIIKELSELGYRVEWQVLNSTCWVPQNRERVFIIGHLGGGCAGEVFPLREDEGLHPEALGQDWKGWLDKGQMTMVVQRGPDKSFFQGSGDVVGSIGQGVGHFANSSCPVIQQRGGYGYSSRDNESPTLPGQGVTGGIDRTPLVVERPHGYNQSIIKSGVCLRGEGGSDQNQFIAPSITTEMAYGTGFNLTHRAVAAIGQFRRLTPTECERLQGWGDEHTAIGLYRAMDLPKSKRNGDEYVMDLVSDTQRYRITGNGVTADVVREVVKKMMLVGCFDG